MTPIERRLRKLESIQRVAHQRIETVYVDPRKGETEESAIAEWRAANPDAGDEEISWIINRFVEPKPYVADLSHASH